MVKLASTQTREVARNYEAARISRDMPLESIRAVVAPGRDAEFGDGMCQAIREVLVKSAVASTLEEIPLDAWEPILEEAEGLLEEWKEQAREGAPEDSPCIDWQGFDRPSEY